MHIIIISDTLSKKITILFAYAFCGSVNKKCHPQVEKGHPKSFLVRVTRDDYIRIFKMFIMHGSQEDWTERRRQNDF